MPKILKVDGDTWLPRVGAEPGPGGGRLLLFFCRSNDQRPYRVVELPPGRLDGEDDIDGLGTEELRELFARSTSMGAPAG
ncbi:MAG: hypothetical protein RRA92_06945 [Gemmatimonadota bacterium]|nr:hypothetical protein [Gemmatimonadota bacterium]